MSIREQITSMVSVLPTVPAITHKLLKVVSEPHCDADDIGRVIRYDPALTASILRAANSVFLGFSKPVSSLAEATMRLGTKWIVQLALSSVVHSNLRKPAKGYGLDAQGLWQHSAAVAIMSDALCMQVNVPNNGVVYTAGLVHDVGKLVLEQLVSDRLYEIEQAVAEEGMTFEEAERHVFGLDHAEVGALILKHWNLPEDIIEAARWHHNPNAAEKPSAVVDIVHVADSLCMMQGIGMGRDGLQYRMCDDSAERLGLTANHIEKATSTLLETLAEVEAMFQESQQVEVKER
jgi:putative nucleotidyltransferase with HDIG domain